MTQRLWGRGLPALGNRFCICEIIVHHVPTQSRDFFVSKTRLFQAGEEQVISQKVDLMTAFCKAIIFAIRRESSQSKWKIS